MFCKNLSSLLFSSECNSVFSFFFFVQDAYRLQLKMFLYEVKQQQLLSGVRSFLKLYSTISVGKLASYMDVDEPTLRYSFYSWGSNLSENYQRLIYMFFSELGKSYLRCVLNFLFGYRTILMSYKHKTHAVDSDGKIISNADIDFYISEVFVATVP